LRCFRPTFNGDPAVARVQAHHDAAGKVAGSLFDERWIANRRCADNDARNAFIQPTLDRGGVANAAAELDRDAHRFENSVDSGCVHWLAGKGAIQVDDVQMLKALLLEGVRLRGGIPVENCGTSHIALLQPNGDSLLEIDGGKKNHGFHFKKFAISARPRR